MSLVHGDETDFGACDPAASYKVNTVLIRLTDNEHRELMRIARARGKPATQTARSIVVEYLAEVNSHMEFGR